MDQQLPRAKNMRDRARFISELTGYTINDCLTMIRASNEFDLISLGNKEPILFGSAFTVTPIKRETRKRYNINTGEAQEEPEHYQLKVTLHKAGREALDI